MLKIVAQATLVFAVTFLGVPNLAHHAKLELWRSAGRTRHSIAERHPHAPVPSSPVMRTLPFGGLAIAIDRTTNRVFVPADVPQGTVNVLDARTGTRLSIVQAAASAGPLGIDSPTGHVFVAATDAQTISMLDARSGAVRRVVHLSHNPAGLAICHRTGRVFAAMIIPGIGSRVSIAMLDARSGALLRSWMLTAGTDPYDVAVDERAERVFVSNSYSDTVNILDAQTGATLRTVTLGPAHFGAAPFSLTVVAATDRLFVSGEYGLSVLNARTGRVLRTISDSGYPGIVAAGTYVLALYSYLAAPPNSIGWLDPRTGALLHATTVDPTQQGTEPTDVAIDVRRHRVYVLTFTEIYKENDWDGPVTVDVLDLVTGRFLRSVQIGSHRETDAGPSIGVDVQTHRLFALTDHVVVLDTTRL